MFFLFSSLMNDRNEAKRNSFEKIFSVFIENPSRAAYIPIILITFA